MSDLMASISAISLPDGRPNLDGGTEAAACDTLIIVA
jgi:hypothetical protein